MQVVIDGKIQEAPTVREYSKKRGVPIQNAYLRIRRGITNIDEIFAVDRKKPIGNVGRTSNLLKDFPGYENTTITQIAKDIGEKRTTVHMWIKKGTFKEKVDKAYEELSNQKEYEEEQKILEVLLRNESINQ